MKILFDTRGNGSVVQPKFLRLNADLKYGGEVYFLAQASNADDGMSPMGTGAFGAAAGGCVGIAIGGIGSVLGVKTFKMVFKMLFIKSYVSIGRGFVNPSLLRIIFSCL